MAQRITVWAVSLQNGKVFDTLVNGKFIIDATFPLLQFIIQQGNSSLSISQCYHEEMLHAIQDTNDCLEFSLTR